MGMEMEKSEADLKKAGEKFLEGVDKLEPAGDPSDFAQEAERTTAEHRSEHALDADDDRYPEGSEKDDIGHEPGIESPKQREARIKDEEKNADKKAEQAQERAEVKAENRAADRPVARASVPAAKKD
jgi:hypothetical protein